MKFKKSTTAKMESQGPGEKKKETRTWRMQIVKAKLDKELEEEGRELRNWQAISQKKGSVGDGRCLRQRNGAKKKKKKKTESRCGKAARGTRKKKTSRRHEDKQKARRQAEGQAVSIASCTVNGN